MENRRFTNRTEAGRLLAALGAEADDVGCLHTLQRLGAVGLWYEDFSPTTDEEVRDLLRRSRRPLPPVPAGV